MGGGEGDRGEREEEAREGNGRRGRVWLCVWVSGQTNRCS